MIFLEKFWILLFIDSVYQQNLNISVDKLQNSWFLLERQRSNINICIDPQTENSSRSVLGSVRADLYNLSHSGWHHTGIYFTSPLKLLTGPFEGLMQFINLLFVC